MKKPTVLVTGRSSFLAQWFVATTRDALDLHPVDRIATESADQRTFDAVVNFACTPEYRSAPYDPNNDIDSILANRLKGKFGHYFMLSSRLVYGHTENLAIPETQAPDPQNAYARNKTITETTLIDRLGQTVTVLRLANVFGPETNRRTFTGQACDSLITRGEIVLDIAKSTRRDFLPLADFSRALAKLVAIRPGGVLNLGSGLPTTVGDIADWFVRGYGMGQVRATSAQPRDEFCLDIGAVEKLIGTITTSGAIKRQAMDVGRSLQHA